MEKNTICVLTSNPTMMFNFVGTNDCGYPLADKFVFEHASLFTTRIEDESHPFEVAYGKDCWREATIEEKDKFNHELKEYKYLVFDDIKAIRNILHDDLCHFIYKKKDGTIRHAYGTTNQKYLDEHDKAFREKNGLCRYDVIRYYDICKNGWRSFLYKNFLGWE